MLQSGKLDTAALIPPSFSPAGLLNPVPRLRSALVDRGAIRTGRNGFSIFTFETRRSGEAATAPPRTVGLVAITMASAPAGLAQVGAQEAVTLCLEGSTEPPPPGAAHDKVVFCDRRGKTLVFQADRQKQTAALCACGNASGAAAALLGQLLGRQRLVQSLHLPEGTLKAVARLQGVDGNGGVEQTWAGYRFQAQPATLCGRQTAVCRGTFNDYLIVRLRSRDAVDGLSLDEVRELWEAARPWGFENPLRARLVAVAPASPKPWARFFTCGR
ncbi:MAG TPA: hypothetical protein VFA18_21425, partial [Gemmataceae bacterium]|nr:hypothetical protein [Gemmataceae bacterium]